MQSLAFAGFDLDHDIPRNDCAILGMTRTTESLTHILSFSLSLAEQLAAGKDSSYFVKLLNYFGSQGRSLRNACAFIQPSNGQILARRVLSST